MIHFVFFILLVILMINHAVLLIVFIVKCTAIKDRCPYCGHDIEVKLGHKYAYNHGDGSVLIRCAYCKGKLRLIAIKKWELEPT